MPLYTKIEAPGSTIALWRIEEDLAYFEPKFPTIDIANDSKRLQWYATRHLVNELNGSGCEVVKDEAGKPYIANSNKQLSISHTPIYAAAMLSQQRPVGIDLEMINPKVERIAHKFLRDDEIDAIQPEERIEKMILYWSAKEALYKLYGKRNVEFMAHLLIEPFELKHRGELDATIAVPGIVLQKLKMNYQFFEDHVLSYVTGL